MTHDLQALLAVSTRIREYEVSASAIEVIARLTTDAQVQAALRQVALELYEDGARWRRRQDADLQRVAPPPVVDPAIQAWTSDGAMQNSAGSGGKEDR